MFEEGQIKGVQAYRIEKFADDRGWLAELFRNDELDREFHPAMAYVSFTKPGVTRGPHEHREQADLFCFFGPSTFELRMWDNRQGSESQNHLMTIVAGQDDPMVIIIPAGVVHAYRNIGGTDGMVINCPNRLYMGAGRREAVDEIRHEDDPGTVFRME
ncbi:MAG: dTDP-4-dehydrorhamnose 3,5-epimerase family protein [Chloracidobacterium sp.]|nr:dTDP-4-dehydrorhamnose 3,5-epimerase family protein [Chloracidobacterium sp.]